MVVEGDPFWGARCGTVGVEAGRKSRLCRATRPAEPRAPGQSEKPRRVVCQRSGLSWI